MKLANLLPLFVDAKTETHSNTQERITNRIFNAIQDMKQKGRKYEKRFYEKNKK